MSICFIVNNCATFNDNFAAKLMIIFCIGFFPFNQAIGYIYIKNTSDPLDGVSKLDYVHLVSII